MDDASRDHLTSEYRRLVFAGRTSWAALTTEIIPELLEGERLSDDASLRWSYELVEQLWHDRVVESHTWERPTDVERLGEVFRRLEAGGFVCGGIEGSAYTQSDLVGDLFERWMAQGGGGHPNSGYLGCHGQDIERALHGGGLWLAHGLFESEGSGARSRPDSASAEAAVDALRAGGFEVEWNGDAEQRILLAGFAWRAILPLA